MKIKDERSGKRGIFARVEVGQWFIPTESGFWMKTECVYDKGKSDAINAVNSEGTYGWFDDDRAVMMVDTELVIKGNP